jgi:hypothetical protein
VRRDTPKGEAAIELVVQPKTIGIGERVTIRLVNRGTVGLLTGLLFEVERWDGERWVRVPWPENTALRMVGIVLRPGGSTDPQYWPTEGVEARPGCYRAVKSAGVWDLERIRDPKRAQGAEGAGGARLQSFARFSVRSAG